MSKESGQLRNKAANELRKSRKNKTKAGQGAHLKRAASYKSLAESEEWLSGEKQRSRTRTPKKK
jgi:hypothetical protein